MTEISICRGFAKLMLNGFGLQRLGIAAIRAPIISTIIIVVISIISSLGLMKLEFSGENIEILRDGSQELEDYDGLLSNFRNFNNDAVVLMQVDNLASVEGIETLRELSFEYQLSERVESVLSIFSLVVYDPVEGWQSALPASFETDEEVKASLENLAKIIPSSKGLFSQNYDSSVVVVYTKPEATQDANVRETMEELWELGQEYNSDNIKISIAGQPAIRSDLIHSIVGDLLFLVPLAFALCALLALFLFRQIPAIILCALPSMLSTLWFLGAVGFAGIPLNFLTNILPVLIIVIVFADTLHLYMKWQKHVEITNDRLKALRSSIEKIGPACALSSITTAVALLSLCASGNNGLFQLGVIGAVAVITGFFSVIIALPLAIYWSIKADFTPTKTSASKVSWFTKTALYLLQRRTATLAIGALICVAGLYAHLNIDSRFRLIDYLGNSSTVGKSEGIIDQSYSGTTPLFAIVQMDTSLALDDPKNEKRAYDALAGIAEVFPPGSFYSLADFAEELKKSGQRVNEELIDEIPPELSSRFISKDRSKLLITMFASANKSAKQMQQTIADLNVALEKHGVKEYVKITGYPILSGVVAPRLMDNLRISLLLAVMLSILVVIIASRSIKIGLACLVPNLLPIVSVELILFLANVPLNMSITVALTVAFGIAVDDSIHMINQYLINKQRDETSLQAVQGAIKEVTPAIFSTTVILSGGLFIMCFSALPAMAIFALVIILTLIIAFLADIFQLPSYLMIIGDKSNK